MSLEPRLVEAARTATEALRRGEDPSDVQRRLDGHVRTEAMTVARLRKKAAARFEDPWELWFDEQALRYATPDTVARARAERLAPHGDRVVDVACGAGIQLAMLAQRFDEAIGIEKDPARAELARRNAEAIGVADNTRIIEGDCLDPDMRALVDDVDVVFCDPARDPEAPKRVFGDLHPDVRAVHGTWAEPARAWCYELPPMMPPERVRPVVDGECEYTSLGGELNRLAVYGGAARACDRAALALPTGERLDDRDPVVDVPHTARVNVGSFLYVVDRAVLSAGLMGQLAARAGATYLVSDEHPRRTLLGGPRAAADTALCESHEVLATGPWDPRAINETLHKMGDVGKVTLRAGIDPSTYWDVRNALEAGLNGTRHAHVFRVGDRAIVCAPTST